MAKTSSAKKAHRVATRRHVFNIRRKSKMKDAVKDVSALISAKTVPSVEKLSALYKAIDKAAKGNSIKKNTASRMKSRVAKRIKALAK